jgi:5'-deoxynucleotidase YfbR-like HD superfamily hydrolase
MHAEITTYQALLEFVRENPHNVYLQEDLAKAQAKMEIAWLEKEAKTDMYIPTMHEIETFTGRYINLADPDPKDVCLEDIAHGLGATARFNGMTRKFYSVAEHAVFCSHYVEQAGGSYVECLAALHHDDAEAYLGDVARPLKLLLQPEYGRLSGAMDEAIAARFHHAWPADALSFAIVKEADNFALFVEACQLLRSRGVNWGGSALNWDVDMVAAERAKELPVYWEGGLTPVQAEGLYLSRHWELIN